MPPQSEELQVGDIGADLELEVLEDNVAFDISSATTKNITLQRPDLTTVIRAAVFSSDGTNGKIIYTTDSADLTMEGTYSLQAYLVLPSWTGYSSVGKFEVHANLV